MSSFICSPKHFNSVEQSLIKLYKSETANFYVSTNIEGLMIDIPQVIDTLRNINALAVILQYAYHYDGNMGVSTEVLKQTNYLADNKKDFKLLNPIQLFKAFQCIDYQIEIDHITDIRELTTGEQNAIIFLNEIIKTLAVYIVEKNPDYSNAGWCID